MFSRCTKFPLGLQNALGPCQMRCQNLSKNEDKEYQVSILYDALKSEYVVFAAWGRWGSTLDGQEKGRTQLPNTAVNIANDWVHKKAAKGYKETPANHVYVGTFSAQVLISAAAQIQPTYQAASPVIPQVQRRAPSSTNPIVKSVVFDDQKWRSFLKKMGATQIQVQKYYFEHPPMQMGTKDYERLMYELFLDAVEAGAVQLPQHVQKEDFDFHFTASYSGSPTGTLAVDYKPSSETQTVRCTPDGFLGSQCKLSDHRLERAMRLVCSQCISAMQL